MMVGAVVTVAEVSAQVACLLVAYLNALYATEDHNRHSVTRTERAPSGTFPVNARECLSCASWQSGDIYRILNQFAADSWWSIPWMPTACGVQAGTT